MEISFDETTLQIDDHEIEFEEEIHNVLRYEESILVQFKRGHYDPRNLLAVDSSGTVIWRVEALEDRVSGKPKPVNMVKQVDDDIVAYTGSERYEINPNTGEAEFIGGYK